MNPRTALGRTLEVVAVLVVVSLLLGSVLGQPVLLSYVETGSMAPTLRPGDGFVAVPAAVAGPVERGDVIVFRAERLHGGGLVTHRVVGETDRGYVTRGDANPFTDQASAEAEPPVQDAQVVATALAVGGSVIVVPGLGAAVTGVQSVFGEVGGLLAGVLGRGSTTPTGLASGLAVFGLALYAASVLLEARGRERRRDRSRSRAGTFDARLLVVVLAAVVVASTTASMAVPGGVQKFGVVSAENDAPGPRVIQQGTTENATYRVDNGGVLPVVVFLEPASDGVDVRPREVRVAGRDRANATVALSAPPEIGYYRLFVAEHRYLAVLPYPLLRELHEVHPWLPVVVIDALVATVFLVVGFRVVGTGTVRLRSTRRSVPITVRVRRISRRLRP